MKEEGKHKKRELSDFERYVRGEMSKREENAFQRKLQRDPFTREATEGFTEISPQEATKDLTKLGRRLKIRIRPVRRIVFYRIAASIAVLMVIASVFVIVQKFRPSPQLSESTVFPTVQEKTDTAPLTQPLITESVNESLVTETKSERLIADKSTETETSAREEVVALAETTEILAIAEKLDSTAYITADQVSVPVAASRMAEEPDMNFRDKKMQIAQDSSISQLSKVVTAGYSTAKRADTGQTGSISPQPVTGSNSFERYIEENIRKPQSLAQGERAVAVVSFLVRTTGAIDSLKVIESQGEEFATEAMRLIREGPAWIPGQENGQPVDDEVRLRIIFR